MNTTKTVGENIRRLRKQRGLTIQQLAEKMEGSPHFTTVARFERGSHKVNTEWMHRVAEALGVPPSALLESGVDFSPVRKVPVAGIITAGNWREAVADPVGWISGDVGGANTFALQLDGDSMDKVAPSGSYIYVDPDDVQIVDGKFYAIMNATGETTFKRYRSSPMQFEPCSSNEMHQPIVIGKEPFTIIGRVIGAHTLL